ncbi:aspartyl protease family protein [Kordia sp.]|uniref:retropepsin-like aspartic protease n=1 Tax=Kordia sp. TaxID=1965332 RepID=UPI0025BA347A|nr:aspartyl protease family protein [Kordia sp.]MCH2192829.1 aspartyl protease family protein [Kordia sp.]
MKIRLQYIAICAFFLISFIPVTQAQVATIPFENDELMFIKVKINDHDEPLNFVFDTGASTAVLDENVAKKIGIKADYQQPTEGAAGTEMYNIALSQKYHIGSISVHNAHTVLVDLERLSKRSNQQIDGIIGNNIMQQYVTQIDYDNNVIKLYNDAEEIQGKDAYKTVEATFDYSQIPQVNLEFTLTNNQKFKGNFLFDSGANMTFLLNTPFVKEKNMESLMEKTIENKAEGLTTSSNFKIGKVAGLQFGDFTFGEMPIDLSNSKAGVMASAEYTGILGIKIISRFNTILDYKQKKIYLKPSDSFKKTFRFPRSGISLAREADMIKVSNVITAAEAYEKGIREGDQLLEINDVDVKSVRKCREILRQKDKTVKLKLKTKKGEIKTVTILLKRLI